MEIPDKINIYGQQWDIVSERLDDDTSGECIAREKRIRIDSELEGEERMKTFFHEQIHAVLGRIGVSQALSYELEEIVADSIATYLVETYEFRLKEVCHPI